MSHLFGHVENVLRNVRKSLSVVVPLYMMAYLSQRSPVFIAGFAPEPEPLRTRTSHTAISPGLRLYLFSFIADQLCMASLLIKVAY